MSKAADDEMGTPSAPPIIDVGAHLDVDLETEHIDNEVCGPRESKTSDGYLEEDLGEWNPEPQKDSDDKERYD